MENQDRVDYRLPIYKEIPIKHKIIICEPLLSQIDFRGELGDWVEQVVAGGESIIHSILILHCEADCYVLISIAPIRRQTLL